MIRRLHLLILAFTFFGFKAYAQPCSAVISATDSLICWGDSITLNALANGPDNQLDASNTAGNNHRGNMFDIVATNAVTILSFDASPMSNTTIEIYYKVGTWNGFANTPSAWTYIGSAPVTYTGGFSPVPVDVNITIPAGQTYAFYVTSNTSAVSLNYSNGTNVGNIYSSDANITFLEGGGLEYPFTQNTGAVYQPRVWNGRIHYALANQPGSTLTWGTGETTASIPAAPTATATYTVSATVPGCPATLADTLNVVVSIPVVTSNSSPAVCSGDELLLYGSGAESYAWTNGVTDSVPFEATTTTTYVVTGTDSIGCTDTDTVTITVNELPNVNAGADFSVCEGNNITLSGQGANTYIWNNGVTDNMPFEPDTTAAYIVTGTDTNGCVKNDTITVTVNLLPVVSAGPDLDLCQGIPHTFSGSGAQTYTWDNGVTNGIPTIPMNATYTVTGTDANGCSASDQMNVTIHNVMSSIFSSGGILTAGVLVDMSAQWINCSDMSIIPGETDVIFEPAHGGSYAIIIQDNVYGCIDTSNCVDIQFAGINEMPTAGLNIYPVPTNGKVTVASSESVIEHLELIDVLGKVLETSEPNTLQTELDLSAYESNTFFLRIYRAGQMSLLKVVKN
ncbi:T9SS type A sorting domain-containing protein [Fluviicola chungangensis]|uniref:T9SS type A sorting domain-containing protein n=1 Tax=Fluviicola chungangensis TaxID=2597671 RepID=A0A556MJK4_9FLAO|nr:T9SS type A sorting domain-containing protein [Fluviicola chungangensis]TSJ40091.1 T9SS type A sorting domain-containing protein [Fluviicola chungangensis]